MLNTLCYTEIYVIAREEGGITLLCQTSFPSAQVTPETWTYWEQRVLFFHLQKIKTQNPTTLQGTRSNLAIT